MKETTPIRTGNRSFFQIVRWLRRVAIWKSVPVRKGAGESERPPRIHFEGNPSMGFPGTDVAEVSVDPHGDYHAIVNCFGLLGSNGILPFHYSELILHAELEKRHQVKEFLDFLVQRYTELFYEAWELGHPEIAVERGDKAFLEMFRSLAGMGRSETDRFAHAGEGLLFCGGLLNRRPLSAQELEGVVQEYFGMPAKVVPFRGGWVPIHEEDQTRIGCDPRVTANNSLGATAVLGHSVYLPQSRFLIRLGPMELNDYLDFLPGNAAYESLRDLVYFAGGLHYEAEVQLCLRKEEVRPLRLRETDDLRQGRLGWTTWLQSDPPREDDDQFKLMLDRRPWRALRGTMQG